MKHNNKRGWKIGIVTALLAVGVWGCSSHQEEAKTAKEAKALPPVAVEVVPVRAGEMEEAVEVVGTLTPRYEARLRSEYAGIVSDVFVDEWVRVKKGTPLARLDTREIEVIVQKAQAAVEGAKAQVLQAEVGTARAEREWTRAQNLREAGLITQQMFDEVKTEKAASQARLAAARAQLLAAEKDLAQARTRLAKAVIRSPMDGVVAAKNINVGDLVGEPGAQRILFQIVDNRFLELTASVPSQQLQRLKTGQTLVFSTDAFPGQAFEGRVQYINPTVSEADRSVKILAEIPNPKERLKPGLFVKGRIITATRRGVIQIPRSALQSWEMEGKTAEVYVVEGNRAQRRGVRTGSTSGEMIEIVSGLKEGETVVTRGAFNLKNGDPVKVVQTNGGK